MASTIVVVDSDAGQAKKAPDNFRDKLAEAKKRYATATNKGVSSEFKERWLIDNLSRETPLEYRGKEEKWLKQARKECILAMQADGKDHLLSAAYARNAALFETVNVDELKRKGPRPKTSSLMEYKAVYLRTPEGVRERKPKDMSDLVYRRTPSVSIPTSASGRESPGGIVMSLADRLAAAGFNVQEIRHHLAHDSMPRRLRERLLAEGFSLTPTSLKSPQIRSDPGKYYDEDKWRSFYNNCVQIPPISRTSVEAKGRPFTAPPPPVAPPPGTYEVPSTIGRGTAVTFKGDMTRDRLSRSLPSSSPGPAAYNPRPFTSPIGGVSLRPTSAFAAPLNPHSRTRVSQTPGPGSYHIVRDMDLH